MSRPDFRLWVPVLLSILIATAAYANDPVELKVHEWGTFTSIAGADGQPVSWRPSGGPTDLPCFVDRFRTVKSDIPGTVRMETPVLY